jgi:hypothetical protein
MVRMFVHHSVKNYRTWRKAYDSFDAERKELGVIGDDVYQAIDDPNDVTVYHDFMTRRRAENFAASIRLREVMKAAGVTGRPKIWFVKETRKTKSRGK